MPSEFGFASSVNSITGSRNSFGSESLFELSIMSSEESGSNATQYSLVSTLQLKAGIGFASLMNLKPGHRVLDMGCGTGEVTRFLAEQVGEDGEVVGVDPDEERIRLAKMNMADVPNVTVQVGDSVSGFPHANEAYYNLHFSNHVFHWLDLDERQVYVKKAFQCLQPQGLLAIQCLPKLHDNMWIRFRDIYNSIPNGPKITGVDEHDIKALLVSCGFSDVEVKLLTSTTYFNSFDDYDAFFSATFHIGLNDLPDKQFVEDHRKDLIQPDGRVKVSFNACQIKGRKPDLAL